MKRIDTSTVEADKHGSGRDGFRYGDPAVPTAPTEVDDTWLDNVQEELARAVERGGIDSALDENDFEQLHRVVNQNDGLTQGWISGFDVVQDGGLDGELDPGVFYYEGRRYSVSLADITAMGTDTARTYTANRTTYLTITPDDTDGSSYTVNAYEQSGAPLPTIPTGEVFICAVTTNGTDITSTQSPDALALAVPRNIVGYGTQMSTVVAPQSNATGISDQEGNSLGREPNDANGRYWRRVYAQERYTRDLSTTAAGGGRHRSYMRTASVAAGGSQAIALDYSDLGNSQAIGIMAHVVALRTDVTTGQSKMWHVGRLITTDNVGAFSFEGAEIRQEVTVSGLADVSWSISALGADPFIVCEVAGGGGDWDFYLYINTITTDK